MSRVETIEQQAAQWLMRRAEPDWSDAEQADFDAWLDGSAAHKAAYWRLEYIWAEVDRTTALPEPRPQVRAHRRPWRKIVPGSIGVALAASLIAVVGLVDREPVVTAAYAEPLQTAIGQQGNLDLPDGSKLMLNTDTKMRVAQEGDHREIWLDRGETYLEVKHDPAHPFVVHLGDNKVTVLGTKFAVSRQGDRVTVAVLQGRVRLETPHASSDNRIVINQGAMAIVDRDSTLISSNVLPQIERRLQWRSGVISLENSSLGEAAAQFNRYNQRKLVIADPEAANLRIGGSFKIGNVEGFARLLHDAYGLEVRTSRDRIVIL